MILANVIWASNWPFWFWWLPVSTFVGFIAEFFSFHIYQRCCHSWRRSLCLVTVANMASFVGGFIGMGVIGASLPDRSFMGPDPLAYPPWQRYYVIPLQFFAAYFLSVLIEFAIYRRMFRKRPVHRLATATAMSNLASYAIIFAGYMSLWNPGVLSPDKWFISLFQSNSSRISP